MTIHRSANELMLGSRLKRLGERLFAEVGRVYRELRIPFEPAWFPVFFLLDRHPWLPVTLLVREMGVTDSAISQLLKQVQHRGLVEITTLESDRRARVLAFSPAGRALLERVRPVWQALSPALAEMASGPDELQRLLKLVTGLESGLGGESLAERVKRRLHTPLNSSAPSRDEKTALQEWRKELQKEGLPPLISLEKKADPKKTVEREMVWACRQGGALCGVLTALPGKIGDRIVELHLGCWDTAVAQDLLVAWRRDRIRQAWLSLTLSPGESIWGGRLAQLGFLPEQLHPALPSGGERRLEWRWHPSGTQ